MRQTCITILALGVMTLAGCGKKEAPPELTAEPPPPPSPMPELWAELETHMVAGDTNAMRQALTEALADPAFADYRADVFREMLQFHIMNDDVDAARSAFLEMAAEAPDTAISAVGFIAGSLVRRKDYDALLSWCDQLETLELPQDRRIRVAGYRLEALRQLGNWDALEDQLRKTVEDLGPQAARALVSSTLNALLKGDEARFVRFLDFVEESWGENDVFAPLTASLRIRFQIKSGRLQEAFDSIMYPASPLAQNEAGRLLDDLLRAASKDDADGLAASFCETVVTTQDPVDPRFRVASRRWLQGARDAEDAELLQDRLSAVLVRGGRLSDRIRLVNSYFYFILDKAAPETLAELLEDCDQLNAEAGTEEERQQIASLLLDGSFILRDYDRVLLLLEAGIPGKDAKWHATLIPKVKAHKALAENNVEEAIRMFRQFMGEVADMEQDFPDPVTGRMVPVQAIMAQNALRISELWESIGTTDKATAAREEAIEYYQAALERVEKHSDTYKELQDKLNEIQ